MKKKLFSIVFAVCLTSTLSIVGFAGILDCPGVAVTAAPSCQPGQISTAESPCGESSAASSAGHQAEPVGFFDFIEGFISTIL